MKLNPIQIFGSVIRGLGGPVGVAVGTAVTEALQNEAERAADKSPTNTVAVAPVVPPSKSAILNFQLIGPAATFLAAIAGYYGLDLSADDLIALISGGFVLHAIITWVLRRFFSKHIVAKVKDA